jgi:hypothetical protein
MAAIRIGPNVRKVCIKLSKTRSYSLLLPDDDHGNHTRNDMNQSLTPPINQGSSNFYENVINRSANFAGLAPELGKFFPLATHHCSNP